MSKTQRNPVPVRGFEPRLEDSKAQVPEPQGGGTAEKAEGATDESDSCVTAAGGVVMVDELRRWPTRIRCFKAGSCHLTIDHGLGDVEALHAFARRLGLRRSWFQPESSPHYDLTPSKRQHALELGAAFVPGKEQARARIANRRVDLSAFANANNHLRRCPCRRCSAPEKTSAAELLLAGGPWLGAARGRIKWHPGGDRVTWGSGETLTLSVADIEHIAACAAAAAHNDAIEHAEGYYTSPLGRLAAKEMGATGNDDGMSSDSKPHRG